MIFRGCEQGFKDVPKLHGGEGICRISSMARDLPDNLKMMIKLSLAPCASVGYHEHEGETEYFIILEGRGRVRDDDVYADISAGDVTATRSGHGHMIVNTGDTDLVYIAFVVKD